MTIVSIKMIVEKVYKGNLKVGAEMIFGQGGSDCLVEFQEEEVGTEFLLPQTEREETLVCGLVWAIEPSAQLFDKVC